MSGGVYVRQSKLLARLLLLCMCCHQQEPQRYLLSPLPTFTFGAGPHHPSLRPVKSGPMRIKAYLIYVSNVHT